MTAYKRHSCWLLLGIWFIFAIALAIAAIMFDPSYAFADEEIIYGSEPGMFDIPKQVTKLLYNLFSSFVASVTSIAGDFYNIICQGKFIGGDLSAFPEAENMIKQIINQVIVPIAQGCLGVMLAFELLRMEHDMTNASSAQNLGLGGFEQFIFFAVKYAALYVVINHVYAIMYGIFSIFNWVTVHVQSLLQVSYASNAISAGMFDQAFQQLTYDDAGMMVALAFAAIVLMIVVGWTAIYSQMLAISRIFEIFIYMTFAAIPATTFANKSLNNIGIEFIKQFCGACLQLAIIYVIVGIGGPIIANITGTLGGLFTSTQNGIDVIMATIVPIVSCLALYEMIKASRTLANKVFGIN